MKKPLLVFFITVFAITLSNAQEFKFAAKAGLNLATFTGDALTVIDTRLSFHIGGLVEIPLSEKFSIQPELLYSEKGSNLDTFFSSRIKTRLNYLDIPVMAKYHIVNGLSAEIGPVTSILVKADGTSKNGTKDISDFYKTFDFGIGGGVTYRIPMGMFFSLRFTKGLMNINDGEYSDSNNSTSKVQNNVFQVSTGYFF